MLSVIMLVGEAFGRGLDPKGSMDGISTLIVGNRPPRSPEVGLQQTLHQPASSSVTLQPLGLWKVKFTCS